MAVNRVQKYNESYHSMNYSYERFQPPLQITGAICSMWGPGDGFDRSYRDNLSLSLLTRGAARFYQQGRNGAVANGEVFIAQKGCGQKLLTGSSGFLHKRSIILEGPLLDSLITLLGLDTHDVIKPVGSHITAMFRQCYYLLQYKPEGFQQILPSLAFRVLMELGASAAPDYPIPLRRTIDYMKRHLSQSLTLDDVASYHGVSVRQCNRLFKDFLGLSPMRYFQEQKMLHAAHLIENSQLSIKEVAQSTGFDDPLYFSHQFKRFFKLSPRNYRLQGRDIIQSKE